MNQRKQRAVRVTLGLHLELLVQAPQPLQKMRRLAVSQQGVALHLQIQPIRVLVLVVLACVGFLDGNLGTSNFPQRSAIAHHAV